MNPMMFRLQLIHNRLDREVRGELSRRFPDHGRLARLKKLRLAIKDQLHAITPRRIAVG